MLAKRFMERFAGLPRAHGVYQINESRGDGKRIGQAATKHERVTESLWNKHLSGDQSLGIVPINDDSNCKFGAIDIDVYVGFNHEELISEVKSKQFPLIPCRSKSGGLHLYLFTSEWVPAALIQNRLREMASALGYGTSEIFPKQTQILSERGDIGQWINMPYFAADNSDRYAYNLDGDKLTAEGFLDLADSLVVTKEKLNNSSIKLDVKNWFQDGPPCLKYLSTYGFPEGTRNDSLFNVGVYLRLRYPDDWAVKLEEYNFELMKPPLKSDEILAVAKSLRKKNYGYTCTKNPIAAHCHMANCRVQKYGVGQQDASMPVIHGLTKFDTDPPIWFIDVDGGGRLECITEDLQNQRRFQKKCMEVLNTMPPPMSNNAWAQVINQLMENLVVIKAPRDASETGQLWIHIENFCTSRQQSENKDGLLTGRPWHDEETNTYYFSSTALMEYLDRHHFRIFKIHQVTAKIREGGGRPHFFNIKKQGINVWSVTGFDPQSEPLDLPSSFGSSDDKPF